MKTMILAVLASATAMPLVLATPASAARDEYRSEEAIAADGQRGPGQGGEFRRDRGAEGGNAPAQQEQRGRERAQQAQPQPQTQAQPVQVQPQAQAQIQQRPQGEPGQSQRNQSLEPRRFDRGAGFQGRRYEQAQQPQQQQPQQQQQPSAFGDRRAAGQPGFAPRPGGQGYAPQYRPNPGGRPGYNNGYAYDRGSRQGFNQGYRGGWNSGWRSDRRYDWLGYRANHYDLFRLPRYYAPYGRSYGYRRFSIGVTLDNVLFGQNYWIGDPSYYRLPETDGPFRWVRYYNDALLIDLESGEVVDAVYGIFY